MSALAALLSTKPAYAADEEATDELVTLQELKASGLLITVIPNKLYFVSIGTHPKSNSKTVYFTTDYHLTYAPYFADFGPLNLSCLVKFCRTLMAHLENPKNANKEVVYYSGHGGHQRANAGYLIACFCVLALNKTAAETLAIFQSAYPPFLPFRDASYGVATFSLTLYDCLAAVEKAKILKWVDLKAFDVDEYDLYDAVDKGDWNWIVPNQFVAFSSPVDGVAGREVLHVAQAFRDRKVRLVIRLNENLYDRRGFTTLGIEHMDLQYPDGSVPSDAVANQCLKAMERTINDGGAVAVHCKAGLGRTGTVIGLYVMKHYGFSAREFIAWCRICRPGSVIGPQQQYLELVESRLRRGPLFLARGQQSKAGAVSHHASPLTSSSDAERRKSLRSVVDLTRTTTSVETQRRKLEAEASLYDESFVPQQEKLSKFKYESSMMDSIRSSKSPTRQALTIHSGVEKRRLQGSPSLGSELTQGKTSSGATRAASQMSFFSATSSVSASALLSKFFENTLSRHETRCGSVKEVMPDVFTLPSRIGDRGPGWLRPTEHRVPARSNDIVRASSSML